jgi:hypothetical protein
LIGTDQIASGKVTGETREMKGEGEGDTAVMRAETREKTPNPVQKSTN